MRVGRIAADDQDDVGLFHQVEVLRAGRCAEGLAQPRTRSVGQLPQRGRNYAFDMGWELSASRKEAKIW